MKRSFVLALSVCISLVILFLSGCSAPTTVFETQISAPYISVTGLKNQNLSDIEIPPKINGIAVGAIGEGAFKDNSNLERVILPEDLRFIHKSAFENCTNLKTVELGEDLFAIDSLAFAGCTELTSITIPKNVIQIDATAFANCTNLNNIVVDAENSVYYSVQNCIIAKESNTVILIPPSSSIPEDIPNLELGKNLFAYSNLTEIEIPDNVISIDRSFSHSSCSSFTRITIPSSVLTLGGDYLSPFIQGVHNLEIIYKGTKEQWRAVKKPNIWFNSPIPDNSVTVHCSDGSFTYVYIRNENTGKELIRGTAVD